MSMNVLTRSAVSAYLQALRLPFDAGARVLGRDPESGRRAAAGLAIDRVEASVLGTAGRLFGDARLQAEAALRATAVDERREAMHLRQRAAEVSEDADARVTRKEQMAEARRARADKQANRRSTQAARIEQARRRANAKATASQRETIDQRAKAERIDALDTKAKALAEKEEALAAKAEARRLGDAAARTKARRKHTTASTGAAR
jgi:hypothetical protein